MSSTLRHVTTEAEWLEAQRIGEVHPASLDTEGFVHCSTDEQLPATLDRHFAAVDQLLVLEIDPDRTGVELKWEQSDGEPFPHLYGPIPLDAVTGVQSAR